MPIVTFNMAGVGKLINELKGCQELSPTMDDLFDSNKHKDGVIRNDAGLTEEQADAQKIPFWPSAKSIDPSKLEPVLQLVGDHGVYLITNAKLEGTPSSRGTFVYAKGCNPAVDEDFYGETPSLAQVASCCGCRHAHAIVAAESSLENIADNEVLPTLLYPLRRKIERVGGDGAYDSWECHALLKNKGIKTTIPPRKNAALWEEVHPRNEAVEALKAGELAEWKKVVRLSSAFESGNGDVPLQTVD